MKEATLTIHLDALKENARQILSITNGQTIAVVKNNAYNLGLKEATLAFYEAGIRHFASTNLKECVAIRQWLPDVTVLSLNQTTDFQTLRQFHIACTLPSLEFFQKYQTKMAGIDWHLEWAGDMRRSGCRSLEELLAILNQNRALGLTINGLWTHFSWADEFDGNYEEERQQWLSVRQTACQSYDFEYIHAQNSASIVRDGLFYPDDFARVGIYLFGCHPFENCPHPLRHAVDLDASVVTIEKLSAGQSIGYCQSYVANEPIEYLAVINLGYGDGILRNRVKSKYLPQASSVLINGQRFELVSLMMSHCVAKVDQTIHVGDRVRFYGEDIPVHEFTAKGIGANSEQLSALNHHSLQVIYK